MNCKYKIISIACVMVSLSTINAQQWSLDSCINYAIEHNITVKSRQLERTSAELDVIEAKDRFLPEISANASQSFNFGRGLTAQNTYANRNTSQFGWGVNLSLPLFQGLSAKRQLDYARANLRSIVENSEAIKDDVTLNVMSQYLQVLYCKEIHDVAVEQVRLSEVEMERRKTLLDAGKIAELDLTQAESQLAQDQLTAVTALNDYKLALVDLAQLLQLSNVEEFDIVPLSGDVLSIPSAKEVYENALHHNHAIKASSLAIEAANKNISLAKSGYLPRLSFNAGIGSSYYNISNQENAPFHRQMRDNMNKSLGFTLSIPLFDAFSTRNSVRKAKIQRLNAQLAYDDARSSLYKAIQQAYYQANAAQTKLKASTIARDAAKEALNAMQEKYNYGKANATEFEQAKTTYVKAASESVQAKYESLLRMRILQFYNRTNY